MQSHEYSVVGHSRSSIGRYIGSVAACAASSIAAASLGLANILNIAGSPTWVVTLVVVPISAGSAYAIVHWLFNKYCWRALSWFSQIPNIGGVWTCTGTTMDANGNITYSWSGEVLISQSWEKIRVRLSTGRSGSNSVSAAFIPEPDGCWMLMYSYRNEPRVGEAELHPHLGYCEMRFARDLSQAEGDYFNAKGRGTFGRMVFERKGA